MKNFIVLKCKRCIGSKMLNGLNPCGFGRRVTHSASNMRNLLGKGSNPSVRIISALFGHPMGERENTRITHSISLGLNPI